MIVLLLNLVVAGLNRAIAWIATQSTPRLILLTQAFLLVAYLTLAFLAVYVFSSTYSYTLAIRIPASSSKVWDHIQDVQKNPVSAKQRVRTTIVSETEWHEDIGSNEIVECRTTKVIAPTQLVRHCWASDVSLKGQLTYLLTEYTANADGNDKKEQVKDNNTINKDDNESSTTTILRIFVEIESVWGSFVTPLLRLVLTYRKEILEQSTRDYLELVSRDMGVSYQPAEAWE